MTGLTTPQPCLSALLLFQCSNVFSRLKSTKSYAVIGSVTADLTRRSMRTGVVGVCDLFVFERSQEFYNFRMVLNSSLSTPDRTVDDLCRNPNVNDAALHFFLFHQESSFNDRQAERLRLKIREMTETHRRNIAGTEKMCLLKKQDLLRCEWSATRGGISSRS